MNKREIAAETTHSTTNYLLNCILIFIACAVIGWLWEVGLTFIKSGEFVNRGVLHGPWLPIYGFGALGVYIIFQPLRKHPALVFFGAILVCGLLEYCTGWYLETFKHLKWWDYSQEFGNIDGRVCVASLTAFGLCGLITIYLLGPFFTKLFDRFGFRPKKIICFALVLLFLADFIYSSDVPNTGRGITSEISELDTKN